MIKPSPEAFWEKEYQAKGTHSRVDDDTAKRFKSMGFFAVTALCYDFARWPASLYLTDRGLCRMHPVNGWRSVLLHDKRFLPLLFRAVPHFVPDLAIGVEGGEVKFVIENGEAINRRDLAETLKHYVGKFDKLFVKPAGLSGGAGTFIVDSDTILQAVEKLNNRHAFLVNECLGNEDYSDAIHQDCLSSLRIHLYRSSSGIKCHSIVHKFGTKHSRHVDNLRAGGLVSQVDIETGVLSKGWSPNHNPMWMNEHPESRHKLDGFVIPKWQEKQEAIKKIVDVLNFVDFVGLDVAVTNKGLRLLEVNALPSRILMQFQRPALLDEEFSEMLARKGYEP